MPQDLQWKHFMVKNYAGMKRPQRPAGFISTSDSDFFKSAKSMPKISRVVLWETTKTLRLIAETRCDLQSSSNFNMHFALNYFFRAGIFLKMARKPAWHSKS